MQKRALLVALILAVIAVGWIASGQFGSRDADAIAAPDAAVVATDAEESTRPPMLVQTDVISAQPRMQSIVVNGATAASRTVAVRAETSGRVVALLAERGDSVKEGQIIARLDKDDREARLAEARARLRQREIEFAAARDLNQKGYRAETDLAAAQADLDAARAQVKEIELELADTAIKAPFDGIINAGHVEIGDYVREGDIVAEIIDLDPVLVVGYATERQVGAIARDMPGQATLVDGTVIEGTIGFVSDVAEARTRTYRFELDVDNPAALIRAGITSRITIEVAAEPAHKIPTAAITLSEDGRVGVKVVDADKIVRFIPIDITEDSSEGVWVTGLPEEIEVIIVGQDFVTAGEPVRTKRLNAQGEDGLS